MIPRELLKKIRRIEIFTAHLVDDALAGQYQSAFRGHGMEFEEVRQYQPGDDVRSIDWNVTARSGEPFVKRFREERELTVMLLVDVSASQAFGTDEQLKRELVAEVGATIAFSASRNNDKVGLVCFSDRIELFVPPRKGSGHVLRVIRELLVARDWARRTDLAAALEHLNRTVRRRAVVFVVSDFLDEGYEAPLRIARRKHDVILVDVSDRREHELPPAGLMRVEDPETGRRLVIDTGSRRWRRRYAELARAERERRETMFRRLRIDRIPVRTGQPFAEPLGAFFRERQRRAKRGRR